MASLTIETLSGGVASSYRVGYRVQGDLNFTYLPIYLTLDDIPYTWTVPTSALPYETETTEICPNCSGGIYSDPVVTTAIPTP